MAPPAFDLTALKALVPGLWSEVFKVFDAVKLALPLLGAVAVALRAVGRWQLRRFLQGQLGSRLFPATVMEEATRWYVEPDCSNVDQAQEAELRHAVVVKEPLVKKVDAYLQSGDRFRYLLLLADSGMGKTSFVLNYYAGKRGRFGLGRNRLQLAVIPLGHPRADDEIRRVKRPSDTILLLDALDEDPAAISNYSVRLAELMTLCAEFKKVVITCRTQFFPRDEEIPVQTGVLRVGPRRAGERHEYEFWKLYLCAFTDAQVSAFLRKRYPWWQLRSRVRARRLVSKIPLLTVRPMLLAHVPDVLSKVTEIDYSFELYEQMIEAWLDREESWVRKPVLRSFSDYLAVDLFVKRAARGGEHMPLEELRALALEIGVPIKDWKLSNRSLLNRDAVGNYKFAHRSIMEYLVARRAIEGERLAMKSPWTDQMVAFCAEMIFKLFHDEWDRVGSCRRSLGMQWFEEQRAADQHIVVEDWKWSGGEAFGSLPALLNVAVWLVHESGVPRRSRWTREQKEVDADVWSLQVSVGAAKQLSIESRGESTLEVALQERTKGTPKRCGFVFDMMCPTGPATLFSGVAVDVPS